MNQPDSRTSKQQGLADLPLNDKGEPYDWSHALAILAKQRTEIDRLHKGLFHAETVMAIVEPRSHKAEYLAALSLIREVLDGASVEMSKRSGEDTRAHETPQVRCTHFSGKHTLETRCTWCNWPSEVVTNGPSSGETTEHDWPAIVRHIYADLTLDKGCTCVNCVKLRTYLPVKATGEWRHAVGCGIHTGKQCDCALNAPDKYAKSTEKDRLLPPQCLENGFSNESISNKGDRSGNS